MYTSCLNSQAESAGLHIWSNDDWTTGLPTHDLALRGIDFQHHFIHRFNAFHVSRWRWASATKGVQVMIPSSSGLVWLIFLTLKGKHRHLQLAAYLKTFLELKTDWTPAWGKKTSFTKTLIFWYLHGNLAPLRPCTSITAVSDAKTQDSKWLESRTESPFWWGPNRHQQCSSNQTTQQLDWKEHPQRRPCLADCIQDHRWPSRHCG